MTEKIIVKLSTVNNKTYSVGSETNLNFVAKHICEIEKNGQMAYVVWYQILDYKGRARVEINSAHVVAVTYEYLPESEREK